MEIATKAELREQLRLGKQAGAEPCRCPGGYCVCVDRATALRYAAAAMEGNTTPRRMRDAAFWTGFAQARAQLDV